MSNREAENVVVDSSRERVSTSDRTNRLLATDAYEDLRKGSQSLAADRVSHSGIEPAENRCNVSPENVKSAEQKVDSKIDQNENLSESEKQKAKEITHAVMEGDRAALERIMKSAKTPEEREALKKAIGAAQQALEGTGIRLAYGEGSRMNGGDTDFHTFSTLTIYQEGNENCVEISSDLPTHVGGPVKWEGDQPYTLLTGVSANPDDVLDGMGKGAVAKMEGLKPEVKEGNPFTLLPERTIPPWNLKDGEDKEPQPEEIGGLPGVIEIDGKRYKLVPVSEAPCAPPCTIDEGGIDFGPIDTDPGFAPARRPERIIEINGQKVALPENWDCDPDFGGRKHPYITIQNDRYQLREV